MHQIVWFFWGKIVNLELKGAIEKCVSVFPGIPVLMGFYFGFSAVKGVTGLGDLVFLFDHNLLAPFTTTFTTTISFNIETLKYAVLGFIHKI